MSVRIFCGTPYRRSAAAKRLAHRPGRRPRAINAGADAEPGMVIDPGHEPCASVPSARKNPPTTSICHSSIGTPRSHRRYPPARRLRVRRLDQPMPHQRPVDPRPATAPGSPGGPARSRSAAVPTTRCTRRSSTPPPRSPRSSGAGTLRAAATGPPARPGHPAHTGAATHAPSAATPLPARDLTDRSTRRGLPALRGNAARQPTTRPVPIPASHPITPASNKGQTSRLTGTCKPSRGTGVSSIYRDRTSARPEWLPN